ncbi:transglutaminase-like cysteine peptidase [Photobacterium carnosum]|uniref:transglutaminase-like cysteine peptidase n=1 Tax=Photobacterium carnosum TaxID=2023717 RepID=UPI00128BB74C|nr:transglutaminase-like cysteine peptidase [Photobacterium carnosum]KAE8175523.1 sulfate adenylyltransferase [Photobacterium carnosum]MCD9500535.1 sulfate adenylyltransferase [Photobacterium carnosum]MCD9528479.1 sulfate adenylyltransferase [Photobacterium carnosum]
MKKIIFLLICCLLAVNVFAASSTQQIEKITQFYGERAGKRAIAWRALIKDSQHLTERQKLNATNTFFNQFVFISDKKLWNHKDYWATSYEFVGIGAGDCEDFSIAKYQALLELGINDNKLRLVYAKDLELNQFHMVVTYYPKPSAIPLVLDNLNNDILPANQRNDLLPLYSFNGSKLWLMKKKGQGQIAGKASRLSLWNDLRNRYQHIKLNQPRNIF